MKQSTLGRSSTIFHPLIKVRGRKFCQQAKFVDSSCNIFSDKTWEKKIRGTNASGYQNSGKLWYSKLEGMLQQDIKIQVSCDMKQSTLGCSSTILHPLTKVRGRKFCSGQQAKSVDRSSNIFSDKTWEKQIRGTNATGYQNSGKLWYETKHLGLQFNKSPSLIWG